MNKTTNFKKFVWRLLQGNVLAQSLVFLTAPFLSRLYGPEVFGVYTVYLSIISIFSNSMALSLERAIPLAKTKRVATLLVKACLAIALVLSSLMFLLYLLTGMSLFSLLNVQVSSHVTLLLSLSIFFGSAIQTFTFWQMREQRFSTISYAKLAQSTTTLGMQLTTPGLGLIIGDVLGRFASATIQGIRFWKTRLKVGFSKRNLRFLVRKYYRYPLFSSGSLFLNALTLQVPLLLITYYFGNEIAGFFGLGQRVIGMPIVLLTSVLGQVFYSVAAKGMHTESLRVFSLFKNVVKKAMLYGLPIFTILALLAPSIFAFIFGEEWRVSGEYVQRLLPVFYLQLVTVPVSQTLYLLGHQKTQFLWDASRLMSIVALFFIAHIQQLNILTVLSGYAILGSIFYGLFLFLSYRALRNFAFGT
ncbi:oligosaccharide flippase family protein [Listeria rocourtiae]|uniref:oligosaccharide flippase family protein n=1 Tax=Listeria rocourtiae TaxID=647910 RepID=UPI0016253B4F|nr:oligosaccharide flippase family protein [Listeria rocourtiae]MBC1435206.1 oligosaccharide flippase family protein [Listeria rocourtiae]